jgi:uncharacterized protein (DUF488 family)
MSSRQHANHLFTFGYEGCGIDDFVMRLRAEKVRQVIDVRELPLSRKKGFSKQALRQILAENGLQYVHVPQLGCPKPVRDQYRRDGDWARYTKDFLAYLTTQIDALRLLAQDAKINPSALMCFEADPAQCHRTYVARAATQYGAPPVMHLSLKTSWLDQHLAQAA